MPKQTALHRNSTVRIHHIVTGRDVDPAAVSEAMRISEEKYCSVEAMLEHSAVVRATFEVIDEDAMPPSRS